MGRVADRDPGGSAIDRTVEGQRVSDLSKQIQRGIGCARGRHSEANAFGLLHAGNLQEGFPRVGRAIESASGREPEVAFESGRSAQGSADRKSTGCGEGGAAVCADVEAGAARAIKLAGVEAVGDDCRLWRSAGRYGPSGPAVFCVSGWRIARGPDKC